MRAAPESGLSVPVTAPAPGSAFVRPRRVMVVAAAVVVIAAAVAILMVVSGSGSPGRPGSGPLVAGSARGQMTDWYFWSRPGQATDFAAALVNTSSGPATAVRASVIPAPGFPTPQLVGVAVGSPRIAFAGRGWPVRGAASRLLPAAVGPGRTWLYYSVAGSRLGADYMTLGLTLTYRAGGREFTVNVWGPSVTCVRVSESAEDARCAKDSRTALDLADARA